MVKAVCHKCGLTGYMTDEDYEKILNNKINIQRKEIGLTPTAFPEIHLWLHGFRTMENIHIGFGRITSEEFTGSIAHGCEVTH